MRQATPIDFLNVRFDSLGVSVSKAAETFRKLSQALILIDAPVEAGDWPDCFTVFNRYLRTDVLPSSLNGGRWEL